MRVKPGASKMKVVSHTQLAAVMVSFDVLVLHYPQNVAAG